MASEAQLRQKLTKQDSGTLALVITLMQRNAHDAEHISNQLIPAYQADIERLSATIALIREGINNAYSKPYAPSQQTIINCLWPFEDDIENYIKGERHGRGPA
jgi:hypothetical protein